ncbi:hypothetical protein Tco_0608078 [Tanacetum coccineum]
MRIRQYICHTYHNLWDIIVDEDLQEEAAPVGEQSGPPAPKTAKQLTAKRNQERVKSILLLAIPDEYLLNQIEVHAAPVSKEDINQKFLRSLPPSWSLIALIMRNKPNIDQTDIDDLYNNLRNTSSTNEVSTASGNFKVNTAGGTSSTSQVSSTPGVDEVVCSFFAQQTTRRNLDFKENNLYIDKSKVSSTTVTGNGTFAKKAKSGRKQREISYGDMQRNAQQSEPSSQALWLKMVWEGYTGVMILITQFNNSLMAISSQAHQVLLTKRYKNCSKTMS